MSNKKHYWSQVFVITTMMSCGLGLACGFVCREQTRCEIQITSEPQDVAYIQLEPVLHQCAIQAFQGKVGGVLCPLAQPGAKVIGPMGPIVQRGATLIELEAKPAVVPDAYAQCGKQLRMEGIPHPHCHDILKQRSGPCHGFLDLSSFTILLPLSAFGFKLWFLKKRRWN